MIPEGNWRSARPTGDCISIEYVDRDALVGDEVNVIQRNFSCLNFPEFLAGDVRLVKIEPKRVGLCEEFACDEEKHIIRPAFLACQGAECTQQECCIERP